MPEVNCGFFSTPEFSGSELLTTWGPTLLVDIGFDSDWKVGSIPVSGIKMVNALVDTGAGESCIDDLLATQLNLPIIDQRPISGVGGQLQAKIYLAQIHVPSLAFTIYGAFAGVHLAAGGQAHQALIGRTFLRIFKMEYDGLTGTVIIKSAEV